MIVINLLEIAFTSSLNVIIKFGLLVTPVSLSPGVNPLTAGAEASTVVKFQSAGSVIPVKLFPNASSTAVASIST